MKDIARELGVSVVTVSKVVRNHSDIGEETRQRVLKRIKELNYEPNMAARALVTGRTYATGLIVPDLVHPFFAEVAGGLSDVLRRKNYSLLISSSQGDPDLERQEIKRLLSRRLDALMIASTEWNAESFRRGRRRGGPSGNRTPDIGRVPENCAHSRSCHEHGGWAPGGLYPGPHWIRFGPIPGLRGDGALARRG